VRAAQAAVPPDLEDLATELDHVAGEAIAALDELREITHGIHSSVLTTGGLRPALRALARRAPLPVELHVHVDGRLPEPVETGAYYTVADTLTNTAKYGHASAVIITVDTTTDTDNTVLRLTVHDDDGVGGADLTRGTGLLGLKDRVDALGGHITLHSPPGESTTLHAQIPLTTAHSSVGGLSPPA
jgi:signal transduction histidine kinase